MAIGRIASNKVIIGQVVIHSVGVRNYHIRLIFFDFFNLIIKIKYDI